MGINALNRYTVAKSYAPAGNRRNPLARNNDAHQVERIGCRQCDRLPWGWQLAGGAQRLHRNRQGELVP